MTMRKQAIEKVGVAECVATELLATRSWIIDREADAAYLLLDKRPVFMTINYGMINIDVDDDKQALGVELLTLVPPALKEES